jgi:thioredoxin reductase
MSIHTLPVAIIGGGPIGLAAAAHLTQRKHPFVLFEAGASVATNILSWKHVRVFSPWRYNIDQAMKELLEQAHWKSPDDNDLPTGAELYRDYLQPFAELPNIKPHVNLGAKVISIGRKNIDKMKSRDREAVPFVIQVASNDGIVQYEARAVIDATGTWQSPNPIGSGGIFAIGEMENAANIFYGIPDINGEHRSRFRDKHVLVVGGGHSSVNTILALDKLKEHYPDTVIHWVLRKKEIREVYGGQENDALAARGELGIMIEALVRNNRVNVYTPFQIKEIVRAGDRLSVIGYQGESQFMLSDIQEIICNAGSRPDFSLAREIRLAIDPALESVSAIAALIDPNIHSCGTVRPHGELALRHPEKDFYIVGSKSYGRAPTFLMATGYEQVRSVVAFIDGDLEAARDVQLVLPETGVCNADAGSVGGACCGAVAKETKESACCG